MCGSPCRHAEWARPLGLCRGLWPGCFPTSGTRGSLYETLFSVNALSASRQSPETALRAGRASGRVESLSCGSEGLYRSASPTMLVLHGVLAADVGFRQKPFNTEALARKLREVLDRR
jgi:hypothetical protein